MSTQTCLTVECPKMTRTVVCSTKKLNSQTAHGQMPSHLLFEGKILLIQSDIDHF